MRPSKILLAFGLCSHLVHARYLPDLATEVPELSTFFRLLNSTTESYDEVEQGEVTILAPTNSAFSSAGLTTANTTTPTQLDALLRYQILQGLHSGASLSGSPTFPASILQNATYTNKTGGQVVQALGVDGAGELVSADWSKSKIVTADILYLDGLVHSIDTVLEIPQPTFSTMTTANLSDFIALSEHTLLINPGNTDLVAGIATWSDFTLFAPNSPQYSSNFTGWDGLTFEQTLAPYHYHLINGSVLYSSNLTNGSSFTTSARLNVTVWSVNGSTYINDAKVTQSDLLTANGVMQILDKPLDPNNTQAHPVFGGQVASRASPAASTSTLASPGHPNAGLSTAAQAGIGVGAGVAGIALVFTAGYMTIAKRRKHKTSQWSDSTDDGQGWRYQAPHHKAEASSELPAVCKNEMSTVSNTWELAGSGRILELPSGMHYELPWKYDASSETATQ